MYFYCCFIFLWGWGGWSRERAGERHGERVDLMYVNYIHLHWHLELHFSRDLHTCVLLCHFFLLGVCEGAVGDRVR